MKKFLLFVVVASLFASCIPNKDLIYLQNNTNKASTINVAQDAIKPYRVQVGDILSITIKALDQKLVDMFSVSSSSNANAQMQLGAQQLYFNGYTVDNHGFIRIPVLGEIPVLGYSSEEIRQKIEKKFLEEYFNKEANIFVSVKLAGLRYTINGEIAKPGTNVLYQENATIMEAIANSGDILFTGNRKEVQVIRKFPHGFETHILDLTDANIMNSPYFYIQPNDYILIKPLKQKSWGTGTTGVQTITTIVSALSLITTVLLLSKNL